MSLLYKTFTLMDYFSWKNNRIKLRQEIVIKKVYDLGWVQKEKELRNKRKYPSS